MQFCMLHALESHGEFPSKGVIAFGSTPLLSNCSKPYAYELCVKRNVDIV